MPTKISSYLTELGFKQIAYLGDTLNYNKTTAGEFIVVKENNRLYRYEENSTQPVDNMNVLNTADGGNTRWITVGGAATTQTRVNYTFEEKSNTIPLGMTILSKDNILYVNIGNTQILSSEYSLNDDRNAIILPQEFDASVQAEIVIIIGDFTPEQTGLPDQTGHAGEFLTTDGINPYWADIGGSGSTSNYNNLENKPSINGITLEGNKTTEDLNINSLPDQTGNEGKVLITNGTEASWQTLPETGLPLFAHIWSDHLLTNTSYLRADTFSWQDGNIYYTAYNELVNEKNLTTESSTDTINNIIITYYRTPKGYKIVLPDMADTIAQLYENTGTAWYYILDIDNTRFKLPRNSRYESGTTTNNAGDFSAESLPNIKGSIGEIFGNNTTATGSISYSATQLNVITMGESGQKGNIAFDASRSSSTYQDGAKVNPDHVTQFLYFYVGNTVQNETTINIAEITEALNKKADRDLNNLTEDATNAVKPSDITNCITKIPQDIKLELNDGTLTLKASSKVYVPNGPDVFKEILVNSDISLTDTTNYNNLFVFYNNGILERILTSQVFSGTTAPSGTNFLYWYDTTNNLIKRTNNGGDTWTSGNISFPLGLFSTNGTGFSSIDQVFNGFGYIGSTTFVLPGVEGLSPNGRNTDGSLNSHKFTSNTVQTITTGTGIGSSYYLLSNLSNSARNSYLGDTYIQDEKPEILSQYAVWYSPRENYIRFTNDSGNTWSIANWIHCGKYTVDNSGTGKITVFNIKNTFQAVDRSDTEWVSTQSKPSDRYVDLTLQANGTTYTAPANGWIQLIKTPTGANQYLVANSLDLPNTGTDTNNIAFKWSNGNTFNDGIFFPVRKGQQFTIGYTFGGATISFKFIYDEGSK